MLLLPMIPRALLIQDIGDFLAGIRQPLRAILEPYLHTGLDEQEVIAWIIREELERTYYLFSNNHTARQPYQEIYYRLVGQFGGNFSVFTKHYIKAPPLYGDNSFIDVRLVGRDLFIWYYRDPKQPPPSRLAI